MKVLKAIAWNHTRGYVSLVACAQRYEELFPDVRIEVTKRSLQEFADAPIEKLVQQFDLVVMDHPHIALAARQSALLPLEKFLAPEYLADQDAHSVGKSHFSYRYAGSQWALANDVSTPVATWRPDLIERHGLALPADWEDLLELAKAGFVSACAFPVDTLMSLFALCEPLGEQVFQIGHDRLASNEILIEALERLRELVMFCDPKCLERNPIRTAEWMSVSDDPRAAYCPLAYGYSNYSRAGYARHVLKAGSPVTLRGREIRPTLGGAGIAVSAKTLHPETSVDFASFVASPSVQRGIYFAAGGQPGHRSAWTDPEVNGRAGNFFADVIGTVERSLMRPQFPGYMAFQDAGTTVTHDCIAGKTKTADAARELNRLYRAALARQH